MPKNRTVNIKMGELTPLLTNTLRETHYNNLRRETQNFTNFFCPEPYRPIYRETAINLNNRSTNKTKVALCLILLGVVVGAISLLTYYLAFNSKDSSSHTANTTTSDYTTSTELLSTSSNLHI